MTDDKSQLELVQQYQEFVIAYEALDEKIDTLIMQNDGGTAKMSKEDFKRYREWAQQRAEVLNEMRILEQQLHMDDEDT